MSNENLGEILLYNTGDGTPDIEVRVDPVTETVWLNQAQMAELFSVDRTVISKHLNNAFNDGELDREANVQNLHIAGEFVRPTRYYSLDAVLAVGYRVNSRRGVQFRIWATQTLGEFIHKGFVIDDERLMGTKPDHFQELLDRIRSIRTSEANFHRQVSDIFATSQDYNRKSKEAQDFFAVVQNKFHYAISGKTAAELKYERADASKENMGLTVWKGAIVTAADAQVAKNYLSALDLKRLELLVEQFLAYAELQATERKPMLMADWIVRLDAFLKFNDMEVLDGAGQISADAARDKVKRELADFNKRKKLAEA